MVMDAEPVADPVCATAISQARDALLAEVPGSEIGEHSGVIPEDDRVVTHLFESVAQGYRGWRWAVTVARAPDVERTTIDEVVLLPGPDSIGAPPWVPWSDRIRPDDLRPGDILPTPVDDIRLVPGFTGSGEEGEQLQPRLWELGLGRPRVLSFEGRSRAAERWLGGPGGPANETTREAPARCGTCGFLVPLGGPLREEFGVCANDQTASDGQVVSLDHGCGAHSEAPPAPPATELVEMVLDDDQLEPLPRQESPPQA